MAAKRSSPGEGYVGSYTTGAGVRWEWKATVTLPDSTRKVVHKRGFKTKTAANKALRRGIAQRFRERHGVASDIELVPRGELPRFAYKAARVVDEA